MRRREFLTVVKTSFREWLAHNSTLRAAALAFFVFLPLPSLLLIIGALFSQVLGPARAFDYIITAVNGIAGPTVAYLVVQLLQSSMNPFASLWGAVTTLAFTFIGAVGAFRVLEETLNDIWHAHMFSPRERMARIKHDFVPFLLVTGLVILIAAWTLIASVFFSVLNTALMPSTDLFAQVVLTAGQIFSSFALSAFLFAIVYKQIPSTSIDWQDVVLAAIIAGIVSTFTNYLFGLYLEAIVVTTVTGAAGAVMLLLLWVFIINQFMLFGAHFSKTYATTTGSHSSNFEKTKSSRLQALVQEQ